MGLDRLFLDFSVNKLKQCESRIEDCLNRLSEEQVWLRESDASNAVGNLVLHLAGNVRQWILSGVGGQPDVRNRDREFAARGDIERADLLERIRTTVQEATALIGGLTDERLAETVQIQNYEITVLEAVYHVVEHFAQHTAQIIFATKLMTNSDLGYYAHLTGSPHQSKAP